MEPETKEARQARLGPLVRKTLEDKTWPQVMMVFGYPNPKAERKPDSEFARLKDIFGRANCPNMVAILDLVRFEEERLGVAMSFNLSMRRRAVPGDAEPIGENVLGFFSTPDILVGTRRGVESAFHWFNNLSEAMGNMLPEEAQIFDRIFGEAVEFFKGTPRPQTVEGMITEVVSPDAGLRRDRFEPPFKQ